MSMLSGPGPRKSPGSSRGIPWTTIIGVLVSMALLFGAAFVGVRLIRGSSGAAQAAGISPSPSVCVSSTVQPAGSLPKPSTVTVNSFNGSHHKGLARTTAAELQLRGFKTGQIANDPLGQHIKSVGEIRYGVKGAMDAALLRYYVPEATLTLDKRTDATVDLVTGEAFVGLAPQSQVDSSISSPTPTSTGAGCPTGK
jgi:hypothetical protein